MRFLGLLGTAGSKVLGSVLGHVGRHLGRVVFASSGWTVGLWDTTVPSPLIGDMKKVPPSRAGAMQCTFSVELYNGKKADTTLQHIKAVFHLPGGGTYSANIYDPQARAELTSLRLPARALVTKRLWINVFSTREVSGELLVSLARAERVVFAARYPSGWPYRKQIYLRGASGHNGSRFGNQTGT